MNADGAGSVSGFSWNSGGWFGSQVGWITHPREKRG